MNSFGGPCTLQKGLWNTSSDIIRLVLCHIYIGTFTRSMILEVSAAQICHRWTIRVNARSALGSDSFTVQKPCWQYSAQGIFSFYVTSVFTCRLKKSLHLHIRCFGCVYVRRSLWHFVTRLCGDGSKAPVRPIKWKIISCHWSVTAYSIYTHKQLCFMSRCRLVRTQSKGAAWEENHLTGPPLGSTVRIPLGVWVTVSYIAVVVPCSLGVTKPKLE